MFATVFMPIITLVVYMARPIVLSNGELHIGINKYGLVHDFYFPYVGLENHSAGHDMRHKVGIWVDGNISWLDEDSDWTFRFRYPHQALIGHTLARNERIGILLEFDDFIDTDISAFMRNIHVINLRGDKRDVRLFMHQAFAIGDSRSNTDTAQYLPQEDAIVHYRGRRSFMIAGQHCDNGAPFDQYTVGLFGIEGHEGSYRDADDGDLQGGNVEHGRVDSVLRFQLQLDSHSSSRVHYWIAAGTSLHEASFIHNEVKADGLSRRLHNTADWWKQWLAPAQTVTSKLPEKYRESFLHSLMIIKSHIDKRGAVIASTDTTMLNYSRDAYAYSWPRDGAFALWPLIRLGYQDEPRRFFEFCRRGLHADGYLMHKYRADGALGSSWHPYIHDGVPSPPIQEDETAITLFVFAQYCQMNDSNKLLHEFYESFVTPMANFIAQNIDKKTGLPKPSYDLWEEQFLISTYTTATAYAALLAAVDLAESSNDNGNAVAWRLAANDIYEAAHKHLYNPERKAFYKGIRIKNDELSYDETIDISSFFGAFIFGLFDLNGNEISETHQTIIETFNITDASPVAPRYENDNYQRNDNSVLGNWWYISSLWLAQYDIERGDNESALRVLDWIYDRRDETNMMSEQIDPNTSEFISVSPLTWSHAEYISTLLDLITEPKKS